MTVKIIKALPVLVIWVECIEILKENTELEYCDMEAEDHAGFRVGRSIVDHLFCISQVVFRFFYCL